jgi:hypothetical protein
VATFYGSDTACVTDLSLVDTQITEPRRLIAERLARLLQTDRGGLGVIGDDPNRGFNVRALVNAKLAPSFIAQAQQQIVSECLKDEQVQSATCSIVLQATGALTVTVNGVSSEGPFSLTLDVGQLTTNAVFSF